MGWASVTSSTITKLMPKASYHDSSILDRDGAGRSWCFARASPQQHKAGHLSCIRFTSTAPQGVFYSYIHIFPKHPKNDSAYRLLRPSPCQKGNSAKVVAVPKENPPKTEKILTKSITQIQASFGWGLRARGNGLEPLEMSPEGILYHIPRTSALVRPDLE